MSMKGARANPEWLRNHDRLEIRTKEVRDAFVLGDLVWGYQSRCDALFVG